MKRKWKSLEEKNTKWLKITTCLFIQKKTLFSELFVIASSSQFDRIRKSESKILKRQYNKP